MPVKEVKLYTYSWKAENPVGISVLIIHGLGEHAGRYRSLVERLNSEGIDVYSFDLPGHGKSPGKRGHIASFDALLDYIGRYIDRLSGIPFVLGHSMGGLLALRTAEEFGEKIKGVVASSPAIYIKRVRPLLQKIAFMFDKITPAITFSNHLNPKYLSRDKNIVNNYISDPLVHDRISARLYGEMVRHIDKLWQKAEDTNVPLLIQVGTDDEILPPIKASRLANMWKGPIILKEYEGAYHELYEDPFIGKEAIEDVLQFIRDHV